MKKLNYETLEELGFELEYKDNLSCKYNLGDTCLYFDLVEKSYDFYGIYFSEDISLELHQAITLKIKELGWL